jgi:hypothetical protein
LLAQSQRLLKVSHGDASVVDGVLELFEGKYGKEALLMITRGNKIHEYLGMTIIDYSVVKGKVQINMIEYIKNMLSSKVPTDMAGESSTPAGNHLFQVNKDAERLDEETAPLFHHNVAKLLFLCKQACPDIQTTIAFLCTTRVKEPDVDNYKKLTRTM